MNSINNPHNKIFVNGRFLTQQTSGVQAFARGICLELMKVIPDLVILIPENSGEISKEFTGNVRSIGSLKGHLWEQVQLPGFMKKHTNAVLLNLCNTAPLVLKNQAITLHDLAFIKNPSWFHPAFSVWYRFLIPRIAKKSRHIFTVSETMKKEIITTLGADENKITVIGNKVAESLLDATEEKPMDDRIKSNQFFLMVGSDDPRKNFDFAEKFFANEMKDQTLVIAGGQNQNFRNTKHVSSGNIIRTGYTSLNQLKWLYRNAIGFINPSLYEGFGIPNLEAMAIGCPVICSDIPVFREICGNAVFYFELGNTGSLRNCLQLVVENKMVTETHTLEGKGIFTQIQTQNRSSKIIKALFQ